MEDKKTIRKNSTFIITSIAHHFHTEFKNAITGYPVEDQLFILDTLIEMLAAVPEKKKPGIMPRAIYTGRLLKKFGKRFLRLEKVSILLYLQKDHLLLHFTGKEPWHIYSDEEFNALDGLQGGQALTESEFTGILSAITGSLEMIRYDLLLTHDPADIASISAPEVHVSELRWTGDEATLIDLAGSLYKKKLVNDGKGDFTKMCRQLAMLFHYSLEAEIPVPAKPGFEIGEISKPGQKGFPSAGLPTGFLDVDQACKFLHIKKPTLYARVKEIPHHYSGRRLLFKLQELEDYVTGYKK